MTIQEWSNALSDSLQTPVVTVKEIHSKYSFGLKQAFQMLTATIVTAAILFTIFEFQDHIIAFFQKEGTMARIMATVCLVIFVPTFAYIYSSATSRFLRMIKLD